ncbi:MAG: MBL fold metallo-hydrolase [Erysipelotrichaceae bacterium]|nr:MBL fold metallo-hydrolase [Erysipelotrichaceae bacterium]
MKLLRYNERVWYSQFEDERDRPALGYIKGRNFSIAVDAGHSDRHVEEFYEALKREKLPLPQLTVLTHWHWDHTFGMHRVNGLTIASRRTNDHLREFIASRSPEHDENFRNMDITITREYADDKEIVVVTSDIEYQGKLMIDAGGLPVIIYETDSPHTDDATLVYLPEDRVVFFGDAISGVYPTWVADKTLTEKLRMHVESLEADAFIGGHWPIFTKRELIANLQEEEW